jgi:hypothetical protein
VRIDEVPITPEKIVKALQAKALGKAPRYGPTGFPDVPWPDPLQVPPPWEGGDGRARPSRDGARTREERRAPALEAAAQPARVTTDASVATVASTKP